MDIKEAYNAAYEFAKEKFDTCVEYPDFYVFSVSKHFDTSISVDKKTGKAKTFTPFGLTMDIMKQGINRNDF